MTRRSGFSPLRTGRESRWRGLLYSTPKVLLVDEDFAHQDPELRVEMLGDILEINEELGITVLYVTNKQEEAAGLKKKTVFMKDGKITDIRSS